MKNRRFLFLNGALSIALVLTLFVGGAAYADGHEASVYVVHGIPGGDLGLDPALPVDVSINGACALEGFEYPNWVGPLALPAGDYEIAISLANTDAPCSNDPVIGPVTVPLDAGESATIVAHLAEDGTLTASKFVNDLSDAKRGMRSRILAHHTAAVPPVELTLLRGAKAKAVIPNFTNGDQVVADVQPGEWRIKLAAGEAVVGPVALKLKPFTAYLVYAVGSLTNDTFNLITIPADIKGTPGPKAAAASTDSSSVMSIALYEGAPVAVEYEAPLYLPFIQL